MGETALAQYKIIYDINTFHDLINFISQIHMSLYDSKHEFFLKKNKVEFLNLSARLPNVINNADNWPQIIVNYQESAHTFHQFKNIVKKNILVKKQNQEISSDAAIILNDRIDNLHPILVKMLLYENVAQSFKIYLGTIMNLFFLLRIIIRICKGALNF